MGVNSEKFFETILHPLDDWMVVNSELFSEDLS